MILIYPWKPYLKDFPWVIGRIKLSEVSKVLDDVSKKVEIVNLTIDEYIPCDALNLRKTLSEISIFK